MDHRQDVADRQRARSGAHRKALKRSFCSSLITHQFTTEGPTSLVYERDPSEIPACLFLGCSCFIRRIPEMPAIFVNVY